MQLRWHSSVAAVAVVEASLVHHRLADGLVRAVFGVSDQSVEQSLVLLLQVSKLLLVVLPLPAELLTRLLSLLSLAMNLFLKSFCSLEHVLKLGLQARQLKLLLRLLLFHLSGLFLFEVFVGP